MLSLVHPPLGSSHGGQEFSPLACYYAPQNHLSLPWSPEAELLACSKDEGVERAEEDKVCGVGCRIGESRAASVLQIGRHYYGAFIIL